MPIIAYLYPRKRTFFSKLKNVFSSFAVLLIFTFFCFVNRENALSVYRAILSLCYAADTQFYLAISDEDFRQGDNICHHDHVLMHILYIEYDPLHILSSMTDESGVVSLF